MHRKLHCPNGAPRCCNECGHQEVCCLLSVGDGCHWWCPLSPSLRQTRVCPSSPCMSAPLKREQCIEWWVPAVPCCCCFVWMRGPTKLSPRCCLQWLLRHLAVSSVRFSSVGFLSFPPPVAKCQGSGFGPHCVPQSIKLSESVNGC